MRKLFSLLFIISALAINAQEISDQTFTIKVIEKNGDGRVENMPIDELTFKSGLICAEFSKKNGFTPSTCTAVADSTSKNGGTMFSSESYNSKKYTLKWSGTITGDKVTGKAQTYFFGKLAGEYIFTGTRKKK